MPRSTRSTRSARNARNTHHSTRKAPIPPPPPTTTQPTSSSTAEDTTTTTTTTTTTSSPIFFWKPQEVPYGIFSQWYASPFTAATSGHTYNTAEQYMMHRKALLFSDAAIAAEILATADPRLQRALGRAVKGFDEEVWKGERERIVQEGSYWKFKADPKPLVETGERELVEASPRDRIWGIGFGAERARAGGREKWGLNLLGKALMVARGRLRDEVGEKGKGEGEGEGKGEDQVEGEGEHKEAEKLKPDAEKEGGEVV